MGFALGCRGSASAPETAPGSDWLAQAQRAIAAKEYHASPNAGGLQAPNRAHNLRTYFEAGGIRVHDRTAAGGPALLELTLAGVGRGEHLPTIEPGEVVSDEGRVEIRRPGLVEWYENSPAGLEQGFTLAERPPGAGPLEVELALAGASASLHGDRLTLATASGRRLSYGKLVAVDARGRTLTAHLELPEASRLRLVVEDADAAYPLTIDPLLTATDDTQLESDQANAHLGFSVAGAGDVDGDGYADVIVGAPRYDAGETDEGAAFVFHGSATGIVDGDPLTAAAQLVSDQANARLGTSVAGAGDVNGDGYADVIVGAYLYGAGATDEGAAFVFHGSAVGIVANGHPGNADAQLESDQAGAKLGESVAGAGDVNGDGYSDVVVGASLHPGGSFFEGAAFVFHGSATGLVANGNPGNAQAQIGSDQSNARLGYSVAGAGDVNGDGYADVIVGASSYDAGHGEGGAAFVFHGGSAGIVANGNPLTADAQLDSDQTSALLGWSVAGAGDVNGDGYADVIVGAPFYDASETDGGAAFVFHGSATGIVGGDPLTAAAQIESDQVDARLGWSVAGTGDVNGDGYADVIVGAPFYDADEGAAFLFLGDSAGLGDGNPLTADAQLESDQIANLGTGVAGAGDVNGDGYADVVVGAPFHDEGETNEGAAFVFHGSAAGIVANGNPLTADAQLESDQANAHLGFSVAGAGDVNGDGYADVVVGAYLYDAGEENEGAAFVFHGSATGIGDGNAGNADAQLESNQLGAFLTSVAGAGDVNGDGFADVIVGFESYDAGESSEGAAFVFHGSADGIGDFAGAGQPRAGDPATAAAQLESDQANANLGHSVAGAGDVNGDGYADVIVGAPRYDAGETDEGAAFVFHGSATGIVDGDPLTAAAQLVSDQAHARLGTSVAGAGDVNGDGYADVIVGAYFYDAGEPAEGAAFVFHGSATGIVDGDPLTADAQLESDQGNARLGYSVAGAGDVNGDGFADVIVGALLYDAGESFEGAAFVFHGSADGIGDFAGAGQPRVGDPATAAAQLESDQVDAQLGWSVAGAGDVNGDGYADVIVGALAYDAGATDEGAAFVFHGSAAGIVANGHPGNADAQLESNQASALLGRSVAGAGDVNGDGYADVIVGALAYDAGESDEGAAFVFHGGGAGLGRPVLARQQSGDGNGTPVQPWGASGDADAFEVHLQATHPAGRGRVALEVEYCRAGLPFGDVGCGSQTSAGWTDVTATPGGVTLSESITGVEAAPGPNEARDSLYHWRARVLTAPFAVGEPGITAPPNPAHGPWRRVSGQGVEADIRALPEPHPLLAWASAIALLALLARQRQRRRRFIRV